MPLHHFLDCSKMFVGDWRHRALLHSTFGVHLAETFVFGKTFKRPSDGKEMSTRLLATEHIQEDVNFLPTPQMWLRRIPIERWFNGARQDEIAEMQEMRGPNPHYCREQVLRWYDARVNEPARNGMYCLIQLLRDGSLHLLYWNAGTRWFDPAHEDRNHVPGFRVDDVAFWAKAPFSMTGADLSKTQE